MVSRKNGRRFSRTGVAFLAVAAVVVAVAGIGRVLAAPVMYPPAQEIVYDDFGFTALSAQALNRLEHRVPPSGQSIYIVRIRVTNYAKRVTFDFNPDIVKLYPKTGPASFSRNLSLQAELDKAKSQDGLATVTLQPNGESCTRDLVFVGPSGVTAVRVAFSSAGAVGDVLDALGGGNINVLLPVSIS
jgi:hypothetical protein